MEHADRHVVNVKETQPLIARFHPPPTLSVGIRYIHEPQPFPDLLNARNVVSGQYGGRHAAQGQPGNSVVTHVGEHSWRRPWYGHAFLHTKHPPHPVAAIHRQVHRPDGQRQSPLRLGEEEPGVGHPRRDCVRSASEGFQFLLGALPDTGRVGPAPVPVPVRRRREASQLGGSGPGRAVPDPAGVAGDRSCGAACIHYGDQLGVGGRRGRRLFLGTAQCGH